MNLFITEECVTGTGEMGLRTYNYITAAENEIQAMKNFLYEFDIDNVFDCNDLFDDECVQSRILSIEVKYNY